MEEFLNELTEGLLKQKLLAEFLEELLYKFSLRLLQDFPVQLQEELPKDFLEENLGSGTPFKTSGGISRNIPGLIFGRTARGNYE